MAGQQQQQQQQQRHDSFEARPSNRIGTQIIQADGDTWQETLAVCEAPSTSSEAGKLIIRSYYQNTRSGQRVWDEPPSGASNINPASEEMRRMANIQLSELQVVTGGVPDTTATTTEDKKKKKKNGLFGLFKKDKNKKDTTPKTDRKIQYRPGSKMFAKRGKPSRGGGDSDAQLQEAIARSLAESQGIQYHPGTPNTMNGGMDDEELAKALSMSVVDQHQPQPFETEEEIMARVMEESKREAASRKPKGHPRQQEGDLLGLNSAPPAMVWPEDDRKLPAAHSKTAPTTAPVMLGSNDPGTTYTVEAAPYAAAAPSSANRTNAPTSRKAPPAYSLKSPPNSSDQTPNNKSPVAMFDPYSQAAPKVPKPAPQTQREDSGPKLKKMEDASSKHEMNGGGRLSFGKRTSTKKMQDQAGVV